MPFPVPVTFLKQYACLIYFVLNFFGEIYNFNMVGKGAYGPQMVGHYGSQKGQGPPAQKIMKPTLFKSLRDHQLGDQRDEREDDNGENIAMDDSQEIFAIAVGKSLKGVSKAVVEGKALAGVWPCSGHNDAGLDYIDALQTELNINVPVDVQARVIRAIRDVQFNCGYGGSGGIKKYLKDQDYARNVRVKSKLQSKLDDMADIAVAPGLGSSFMPHHSPPPGVSHFRFDDHHHARRLVPDDGDVSMDGSARPLPVAGGPSSSSLDRGVVGIVFEDGGQHWAVTDVARQPNGQVEFKVKNMTNQAEGTCDVTQLREKLSDILPEEIVNEKLQRYEVRGPWHRHPHVDLPPPPAMAGGA